MGLSVGLDSAVKALRAHQLAVDVASHNIANANTPGFSRQRALLRPVGMTASDRYSRDSLLGRAGNGVEAREIQRVRDQFLDFQARSALGQKSQYETLSRGLQQMEVVFNDPSDDGLGGVMGKFWAAWHDVVNDPESSTARVTLVHATTTMTTRLQRAHTDLTNQRKDQDRQISAIGDEINVAAREIAALNLQIKQVELNGDHANDLRDRRDTLLDELSTVAQITYSEQPDTSVVVYLGNHELVSGSINREVKTAADPLQPGMTRLQFVHDGADVVSATGKLRGVLDARDIGIPDTLNKLNALATGLINAVNGVHTTGYGLDNTTGQAYFSGTDASNIAINATIAANPQQIATAAAANAVGDSSIALAIANLQQSATMSAGTETFDEFYANMVSVLGADVNRAKGLADSGDVLYSHLDSLRLSVSGVNLDEELTNLNSAQHAYNSAARVVTVIDEMLDTLINRTGVAGR